MPPPLLRVLESVEKVEVFVAAAGLEGPEIELFCRPVPKLLNTSAKLDGAFLVSGVRGEPSWGGGMCFVVWRNGQK